MPRFQKTILKSAKPASSIQKNKARLLLAARELTNPTFIDFDYADRVMDTSASIAQKFGTASLCLMARYNPHPVALYYISDNGNYDDTAKGEIRLRLSDIQATLQALSGEQQPTSYYHDIPPQDPCAAAFDLAQLARGGIRGFGNVFFVNCAPRRDERGCEKNNGGETVYAGILPNGAVIAGTGPDVFMHFKDLVTSNALRLYPVCVATNHTQFRSRDYFPWVAALLSFHLTKPNINALWRPGLNSAQRDQILAPVRFIDQSMSLATEAIPDLPNDGSFVARIDTHGNLKLGLRHNSLKKLGYGAKQKVYVLINNHLGEAFVTANSFDRKDGETSFSGGSSGLWIEADGKKMSPLAELFVVGGNARETFGLTDRDLRYAPKVYVIPSSLFEDAIQQCCPTFKNLSAGEQSAYALDLATRIVANGLVRGVDCEALRVALSIRELPQHLGPKTKPCIMYTAQL